MMIARRAFISGVAAATFALSGTSGVLAKDAYKVAIAMPGTITDNGWSQAAYSGLKAAQQELGLEFAYSELVEQPDQVEVLSDYARRGYDLVIGHGGEYQDAVQRVAKRFPDTAFMVNNGLGVGGNVANADFYFSQLGYLMGYTAAKMSKANTIGIMIAQEFKFTNDSVQGYKDGAEAAVPGTKVLVTVTGDWNDVAKGKEAALNQLSQGADVVWPTMDGATVGALQAAQEKKAYAVGLYYDAIAKWPDIMIQSAILDVSQNMLTYLRLAVKGELKGELYKADMNNEAAMRIGTFHADVPEDVRAKVQGLVAKMRSGELKPQPY
ncbi:BMP family protein [Mesorhizobium sp.]|uniref:BMP family protein n=1 Tax=Mesorhizobium sp. TaxID=1871066 RepID=UPI000FE47005|nr:BMP family protein [Mesorhizobium sp.]RWA97841.1 MAG: BMP family ABC transporter substrate-binding protein [Mesorhizobium sp.]